MSQLGPCLIGLKDLVLSILFLFLSFCCFTTFVFTCKALGIGSYVFLTCSACSWWRGNPDARYLRSTVACLTLQPRPAMLRGTVVPQPLCCTGPFLDRDIILQLYIDSEIYSPDPFLSSGKTALTSLVIRNDCSKVGCLNATSSTRTRMYRGLLESMTGLVGREDTIVPG